MKAPHEKQRTSKTTARSDAKRRRPKAARKPRTRRSSTTRAAGLPRQERATEHRDPGSERRNQPQNGSKTVEASLPAEPRIASELSFDGVRLVGLRLTVPAEKAWALCDRAFGAGSEWSPASYAIFVDLGTVQASEGSSEPGWFLCVRMLVRRGNDATPHAVITHAFVNGVLAMTEGRESLGFPALLADFIVTEDGDGRRVTLRGDVLDVIDAERGSQGAVRKEFLELEWELRPGDAPAWAWAELGSTSDAARTRIPFTQLRQFRDAVNPAVACVQEVLAGVVSAQPQEKPVAAVRVTLKANDYRTLGLGSELGLLATRGEGGVVDDGDAVGFAFSLTADGYCAENLRLVCVVESRLPQREPARPSLGGPFRFRRGDPQFAPEYAFRNVDIVGFRIPVSRARLDALCAPLNERAHERGYRYEPAYTEIIVECLHYGSMLSANPPPEVESEDSSSQRELIFRVLVGRVDEGSTVTERPAIYCPFIYVDNPWSLVSGREIIGYPKRLARFETFYREGDVQAARVMTVATARAAKGPNEARNAILTFDARPIKTPSVDDVLSEDSGVRPTTAGRRAGKRVDFAWWGIDDLQGSELDGDAFVNPWLDGSRLGYGAVQLKRFADALDPNRIAYEEVVEGRYTIERFEVQLPDQRAALNFGDTEVRRALNLREHLIVPPGSWYRANCDFSFRVLDPLE